MCLVEAHPTWVHRQLQVITNLQIIICFENAQQPYVAPLLNALQLHPVQIYNPVVQPGNGLPTKHQIH